MLETLWKESQNFLHSSPPKQFDNRTLLRLAGPRSTISWPDKTCTSHLDEFVRFPPFRSYFTETDGQTLWFLWIELCFCIFVNAWRVGAAVGATVCSFGQWDNLRETVSLIWIWRDCPEWFQLWSLAISFPHYVGYGRTRTLMKKCWLPKVQVQYMMKSEPWRSRRGSAALLISYENLFVWCRGIEARLKIKQKTNMHQQIILKMS